MARVSGPALSRAALAVALAVTTLAVHAQATKAAQPAKPPARAVVAAPAAPLLPCSEVETPEPIALSVGKTRSLPTRRPVVRIIAGNASSGIGVPGGGRADVGDAAEGKRGQQQLTAASGGARPMETQAVSVRPGVGEVDIQLLSPTDVYFTGKSIGSTNVVLVHEGGRCTMLNVAVGMDALALQTAIAQLLPDEKEVKVSTAFDSLVLRGTVSDTEALARVTELANAYLRGGESAGTGGPARNPRIVNMLEVGAPSQVMLEVKVAEVSKNLLDQFGIDFSRAYVPGDGSLVRFLSGVFGGTSAVTGQITGTNKGVPLSSVDAVVGGSVNGAFGNGVTNSGVTAGNVTVTYDMNGRPVYTTTYGTVPGRGVTNVALNMQKTDGLVKVLAEPSVMAISGQTGSFLAGGKIFIPVSSNTDNGGRTVTLEEKLFGVSVKFTPTVLGGGRINLKVKPEVSELNAAGITITGIGGTAVLPSFTSRMAETTVQLMDGQSFAIGGLIKNNTTTNIKAFPFLGEVPVLGALFRSTEFQTDRSELVFVITPRLVKPLPSDYRLPTDNYVPPTRRELILEGKSEGRLPAADAGVPAAAPVPGSASAGGGFDLQTKGERK
ncbi:pilus assembly protein N-terminal domain-containing protein [Piscinibacter sp. XHJ-5]|uniref:type II and III secretion system protein family protein n=1 Tax=Piscinibacter sp. XHJ-5 TaxID=3037797 RepID=UPI0024532105|nr:pilus assembly protein N-terminal domain-containing protein [Piscinibacter sp. XHJ-5]